MADFPKDVQRVAQVLSEDPDHVLSRIAAKLTVDSPDLEAMWMALERRSSGNDDLWVWAFLHAVADASCQPSFHKLPLSSRKRIAQKIDRQCDSLRSLLVKNGLDGHLFYCEGELFNGFFLYESLSEQSRAFIDESGRKRLALSSLLKSMAEHCTERLLEEPERGKQGENADAIRFIRVLSKRNTLRYGSPLNNVLMTASNAIFDTQYSEADVAHLLSR